MASPRRYSTSGVIESLSPRSEEQKREQDIAKVRRALKYNLSGKQGSKPQYPALESSNAEKEKRMASSPSMPSLPPPAREQKVKPRKLIYRSKADHSELEDSDAEEYHEGGKTQFKKMKDGKMGEGAYGVVTKFSSTTSMQTGQKTNRIICIKKEIPTNAKDSPSKQKELSSLGPSRYGFRDMQEDGLATAETESASEQKELSSQGPYSAGKAFERDALVNEILYGYGSLAGDPEQQDKPHAVGMYIQPGVDVEEYKITSSLHFLAFTDALIKAFIKLHGKRIVHGDIYGKNAKVFDQNAQIKIYPFDFGFSRFPDDPSERTPGVRSEWHAPELVKPIPPAYNQDVWSIGFLIKKFHETFSHRFTSKHPDFDITINQLTSGMMQDNPKKRIKLNEAQEIITPLFDKQFYAENLTALFKNEFEKERCLKNLKEALKNKLELEKFFRILPSKNRPVLLEALGGLKFLARFRVKKSEHGLFCETRLHFNTQQAIQFFKTLNQKEEPLRQIGRIFTYYHADQIPSLMNAIGLSDLNNALNRPGALNTLIYEFFQTPDDDQKLLNFLTKYAELLIATFPNNIEPILQKTDHLQSDKYYAFLLLFFSRAIQERYKSELSFFLRWKNTIVRKRIAVLKKVEALDIFHDPDNFKYLNSDEQLLLEGCRELQQFTRRLKREEPSQLQQVARRLQYAESSKPQLKREESSKPEQVAIHLKREESSEPQQVARRSKGI